MFVVGGESLIDLVSAPVGADGLIHMTAHVGGSPYNCAIALAKLGNETGFLCPISRDGFGTYLLGPLEAAGARPLYPGRVAAPTTLAVVTLNAKMEAQYEFYRGADRAFTTEALAAALPASIEVFQIGGFCAVEPADTAAWKEVARTAADRGATITIDPNVRPSLVEDKAAYRERIDTLVGLAHLVKVSKEDLEWLDPDQTIEQHAAALLARPKCELVVVTLGDEGSRAFTASGSAGAGIYAPPVFGDTVGAGDSLMAGILTILHEEGNLEPGRLGQLGEDVLARMLRFGAVVAGLNCAQRGCKPPTRAEVDAVLGG